MSINNLTVIGIGKLGICLALNLASNDYNITAIDTNNDLIESINNDTYHSYEPGVNELLKICKDKNTFHVTQSLQNGLLNDIIFIIVPTPSLENDEYDHTIINNIIDEIILLGKQETQKHIIICSTTMPGYCNILYDKIKDYNYTVSYNPEFIAQGDILNGMNYPDIVLIGEVMKISGDLLIKIYSKICKNNPNICRMSLLEAEITKISINCFITTKIAFANMIGDSLIKNGYSPDTVLESIGKDSRIGNKYLKWGYGFGGPCFPRDNRALSKFLYNNNLYSDICIATDKSNISHLDAQLEYFINHNSKEDTIIFNTITYKPNSLLLDESQKLKFAEKLIEIGYNITIIERDIVINELKLKYGDKFKYIIKN